MKKGKVVVEVLVWIFSSLFWVPRVMWRAGLVISDIVMDFIIDKE